jgi:hypothetical protein
VNIETLERQGVRPGSGDRPAPGGAGRGGRGGGRGGVILAGAPEGEGGDAGGRGGYRWNWDTPFMVSHHDPKVWYMGAQMLFKSTDRGSSWQKISGDLTLNMNRDTLTMMGKVVGPTALSRHDGQSSYGSITTIGESPVSAQVMYTGSDDGQVQLTKDGGKTWTNITSRIPVPPRTYVSTVLPSKYKLGRVYVTFDGHYSDDYKPYVFVSDDFGATWSSLSAGLPETSINRIREHPKNPRVLVLAHERGVHVSNDGGATWNSLVNATNMPTVPSDDAIFQERDNSLVIGTHGRGIWILDDAGPLEALTPDAMKADATLFPMHRARLMSTFSPQAWYGAGEFFAPNPDWNAEITYYLRDGGSGQADITIADAAGKTVRTLKGPVARGINRIVWDLRYAPPVDSANAPTGGRGGGGGRGGPPAAVPVGFPAGGEGGGGRGGAAVGPLVLPGTFTVRVVVPGVAKPLSTTVVVDADPLPKFSAADRATRQATLMRIYEWSKTLGAARTAVRSLVAQRDSIVADFKMANGADASARADSLNARIARNSTEIDRVFTAVNGQRGPIENWSGLPTADQLKALGYAIEDAQKAIAELNKLVISDIQSAYKANTNKDWVRKVKSVSAPAIKAG